MSASTFNESPRLMVKLKLLLTRTVFLLLLVLGLDFVSGFSFGKRTTSIGLVYQVSHTENASLLEKNYYLFNNNTFVDFLVREYMSRNTRALPILIMEFNCIDVCKPRPSNSKIPI
jgi:hypothetical protein